jgi:putative transposase
MKYRVVERGKADKNKGVICDQTIEFTGSLTSKKYPELLRRIRYYDAETGNTFVFLTNNFKLSAVTIAALYKYRWGIETFFQMDKTASENSKFLGTL